MYLFPMEYPGDWFIGMRCDIKSKVSSSIHYTIGSWDFWDISWVEYQRDTTSLIKNKIKKMYLLHVWTVKILSL